MPLIPFLSLLICSHNYSEPTTETYLYLLKGKILGQDSNTSHQQVPPSGRVNKVEPFMGLPEIERTLIYKLLETSNKKSVKKVFVDTDTYNEIDDQFALVQLLLSQILCSSVEVVAIAAAPFHNQSRNTDNYGQGMELSYKEIQNILNVLDCGWDGPIYKGSSLTLKQNNANFVTSESATALCELVHKNHSENDPLFVLALGALTNIASAILMDPDIRSKIVVCSLGGVSTNLQNFGEFNYQQDNLAAQITFSSGVPIIHFPGFSVTDILKTTKWELDANVKNRGEIGKFLYDRFNEYVPYYPGRSKTIWDLAPGAWLINPDWFVSEVIHAPILNDNGTWTIYSENHPMRSIKWIDRDPIFHHFFGLLEKYESV